MSENTPVIIVGGGPVGLFLAICLIRLGIECKVLEQKTEIDLHSKSLGIHPVSLELFDKLNITSRFLKEGIRIRSGHAFLDHKPIGTLSLEDCPPPHRYVLSLPQNRTEQILEDLLEEVSPETLLRGAQVTSIQNGLGAPVSSSHKRHESDEPSIENEEKVQESSRQFEQYSQTNPQKNGEGSVEIEYFRNGSLHQLISRYIIGCDGKNSTVRKSARISFNGTTYPDTYIMGDFTDNTDLGDRAAIFLHKDGLTESFPIPGGYRRWVASTETLVTSPYRSMIEVLAEKRSGYSLKGVTNSMISSFGVHYLLAETLYQRQILLAGDAAHIVSPIGGQGMNLGWLGAWDLAQTLEKVMKQKADPEKLLRNWSDHHKKRAATSARRAEWNMKMGRKRRFSFIRNTIARVILKPPFQERSANTFTMRGLG